MNEILPWLHSPRPPPGAGGAAAALAAYFAEEMRAFDLPMAPEGIEHNRKVWRAMQKIPAGNTRSCVEVARAIASSARAAGNACGRNPIPIVIPCHRIAAAGGAIGGYSGQVGAETKRLLLGLEGVGWTRSSVNAGERSSSILTVKICMYIMSSVFSKYIWKGKLYRR